MLVTKKMDTQLFNGTVMSAHTMSTLDLNIPSGMYAEINFVEIFLTLSAGVAGAIVNVNMWAALRYEDSPPDPQVAPMPDKWVAFDMLTTKFESKYSSAALEDKLIFSVSSKPLLLPVPTPFVTSPAAIVIYTSHPVRVDDIVQPMDFNLGGFYRVDYELKKLTTSAAVAISSR